ncbi:MAG: tetratricopeptide repeat protein, partial [Caldilineaceae bacterium]|nr:tetratricopeptide repeat protein [Caldilineaceae bacterium]
AQARQHYDDALPLYEAEQARLGKANTLKSLGDLESRLGNLAQARQHYDDALQLFELEQDPVGKMNVYLGLARLAALQGDIAQARQCYEMVLSLADQIGFGDHPVTQDIRNEYEALSAGGEPSAGPPAAAQALADRLVAWLQTPDWDASQQYLREHAGELLSDEAEAALQLLLAANPGNGQIELHIALLAGCRAVGIDAAYAEFHQATAINAAMNALMAAASLAELEQALAVHPVLLELPTLARVAALAITAAQGEQRQDALALLGRLLWLFDQYNFKRNTAIDPAQHEAFIALHDHLLPVATALGADELALHLRRSAGWACNTLGNHYAAAPESTAQAIAAYTRGLAFNDANAMLLRNRAGEQIEAGDYDAARGDIERAAELEPGARRLPALWCELYAALGDSAALQGRVDQLLAQAAPVEGETDYRIDANFFQAVVHALAGATEAAVATLQAAVAQADQEQRTVMRMQLARLARLHPAVAWAPLEALFAESGGTPNR